MKELALIASLILALVSLHTKLHAALQIDKDQIPVLVYKIVYRKIRDERKYKIPEFFY